MTSKECLEELVQAVHTNKIGTHSVQYLYAKILADLVKLEKIREVVKVLKDDGLTDTIK